MTKQILTCQHCGKTFTGPTPAQIKRGCGKFCGRECRDAAKRRRVTLACLRCGTEFTTKVCVTESGYGKYCSKRCSDLASRQGEEQPCAQCGKLFYVQPTYAHKGKRFCSQECYFASRRTGPTLVFVCQECGKSFKAYLNNGETPLYCSRPCQHRHRTKQIPPAELRRMYIDDNMTIYAIGKHFGVTGSTVQRRLDEIDIKRRDHSERLLAFPRFGNSLEREFETLLREAGLAYQTGKRVGQRVFDFYLPEHNVLIECDGTFWHADPRFFPDRDRLYPVQERQLVHDAAKAALAAKRGYRLLRFWEDDVFNRPHEVVSRLRAALATPA